MSAPAAKAFSLPVKTIAPIASSASRSSSARPISATSAAFSALSACGRFKVTMPTALRRSTRMLAYCSLMHGSIGRRRHAGYDSSVVATGVELDTGRQHAGAGNVVDLDADAVRIFGQDIVI